MSLKTISFSIPKYYTEEEMDIIEEELKEVEDVTFVDCDSTKVPSVNHTVWGKTKETQETRIVFSVKTDNYKHIIGRLELAIKNVLKHINT